tara:strand:+ start:1751 stop:2074 length:324 start_codon:yes stop_codon:yes gene_type:complete
MKINIKPLSINQCFQGRRFKTPKYKQYEKELMLLLPILSVPNGLLEVVITFGLSSKLNDIDNGLKPFIDILQKKYLFNDRDIYKLIVEKKIVPKGAEFIECEINKLK